LRAFLLALAVPTLLAPALLVPATAPGQDTDARPRVLAAHLDNDINPVTQEFVESAVDRAEDEDFDAFVLVLDTPAVSRPRCAASSSGSSRRRCP
jgi:membrane-bound ClpP family serine protease